MTQKEEDAAPVEPSVRPPRRVRYSGKNPRRFEQKYKELRGDEETIRKVRESGKTPAGSHVPVLLPEVIAELRLRPGLVGVDATLGKGGHARALLDAVAPGGQLLAFDADPVELPVTEAEMRADGYDEGRFFTRQGNFAGLLKALTSMGWGGLDFFLADLGVSSMQIDDPKRGFTFKAEGPLDLRLNPSRGVSAADWIRQASVSEMEKALREGADEPRAQELAECLAGTRVTTTTELRRTLEKLVAGGKDAKDSLVTRVFQALRIAVNDEFSVLDSLLRQLPAALNSGGRAAIITFHSGEDRRVKRAFREGFDSGLYAEISKEVIRPSAEEIRNNPRSRSAKLRVCVKA